MKSSDFNQGVTFKVRPQADLRKNGTNTIYLQVTIDQKNVNLI